MASLVVPLASGVVGAASGTAEFYARDTSTTPSVYSDSDAQTAVTTHALDSNGGIVRYVNQSVDVIVKNSSGSTVREFTWEVNAASVEVTNDSFTGTDPVTAATTAGGRTTLDSILTLVATSFGTTNFNLLKAGDSTAVLLKDAFTGLESFYYNVKAAPYEAAGNGTTDDTTAIQDAIDDAAAAGGGVVLFPEGTYRIETSALSITDRRVSLLGVGARASVIKQFTSNTACVAVADASAPLGGQFIQNLGFEHDSSSNTGALTFTSTSGGVRVTNCRVGPQFTYCIDDNSDKGIVVDGCDLEISAHGIDAGHTVVRDTYFLFPSASSGTRSCMITQRSLLASEQSWRAVMTGCTIDASALSSSAVGLGVYNGVLSHFTLVGNRLKGTKARLIGNVSGQTVAVHEMGTVDLDATNGPLLLYTTDLAFKGVVNTTAWGSFLGSREWAMITGSVAGTSYTPDVMSYARFFVSHTSGASMAFANPSTLVLPMGAEVTIQYKNTTGGAITPTFGTDYSVNTVASVGNNEVSVYRFIFDGTTLVQFSDQGFTY